MNFNNYTIKSQEALQQAQLLAQGFGHQQSGPSLRHDAFRGDFGGAGGVRV